MNNHIADAGHGSAAGSTAQAAGALQMIPAVPVRARAGRKRGPAIGLSSAGGMAAAPETGATAPVDFAIGHTVLGAVLVARSDRGLCAVLLGDEPAALVADLQRRFGAVNGRVGCAALDALLAQVVGLIEAPGAAADLPIDLRGTDFQQRVWRALCDIPAGQTASYTEIAGRIGMPTAVRAVAQACGANPLAVIVPCHRVVRSDGALSGYRWGVARKSALLAREAAR